MGCQTVVRLANNLTFTVASHDPDTAVLTDADAVPSYRIYEDEIAVPILTGSMAKLDDANTTGFYSELIACTTANGFEVGRSYNIYIVATVDGDTGGISFAFTVEAAQTIESKGPIIRVIDLGLPDHRFADLESPDPRAAIDLMPIVTSIKEP